MGTSEESLASQNSLTRILLQVMALVLVLAFAVQQSGSCFEDLHTLLRQLRLRNRSPNLTAGRLDTSLSDLD